MPRPVDDDATRYDLMIGLQQVRFWLAGIAVLLVLILWRVWWRGSETPSYDLADAMKSKDCIFCRTDKSIRARTFFEGHGWFAFLDVNPMVAGHSILARQHDSGPCP